MNESRREIVRVLSRRLPAEVEALSPLRLLPRSGRPRKDVDLVYDLVGDEIHRPLWVQVRSSARAAELPEFVQQARAAAQLGALYLLAAPRLDAPLRRALRDARVSHVDLSGALYLDAPGILVRVERPSAERHRHVPSREVNPFADKASLVVRALLREPGRVWGVREMAAELSVSAGLVSRTGEVLVQRGYAAGSRGKLVLADAVAVLMDWASNPPWKRNRVRSFVVPYGGAALRDAVWKHLQSVGTDDVALTQHAALRGYAPAVVGQDHVHAFCAAGVIETVDVGVAEHLFGEPVASGGNLHLVEPALRQSTFFDARMVDGVRLVSPIQLFLDLSAFPVRGAEAATMLLRSVLAAEIGLEREQVARLSEFLERL